jgi:hypothetical protein
MKQFLTEIDAINPATGEMCKWCGPNIPALTWSMAEKHCQENGLGYCKVIGELIAEIPCKPGTTDPDFSGQINYENLN